MKTLFVRPLSDEESGRLRDILNTTKRAHLHKRAQIVLLSDEGKKPPEIASIVGYSAPSVRLWIRRFNAEGIGGLGDKPRGGSEPTWDSAYIETLTTVAQRSPGSYGVEAAEWSVPLMNRVVTRLTKHHLGDERVRQLLHDTGFATTRAKHHLVSPDPEFEKKRGLLSV